MEVLMLESIAALDDVYIQCPGCLEWVETLPTEGVPNQSLRTCTECEHDFLVDIETVEYKVRLSCDRCQMLSINGIACHETGCPNQKKTWVPERGWVRYLQCRECGCDVEEGESCDCMDPMEDEEESE
jgi:hypothetical protein